MQTQVKLWEILAVHFATRTRVYEEQNCVLSLLALFMYLISGFFRPHFLRGKAFRLQLTVCPFGQIVDNCTFVQIDQKLKNNISVGSLCNGPTITFEITSILILHFSELSRIKQKLVVYNFCAQIKTLRTSISNLKAFQQFIGC